MSKKHKEEEPEESAEELNQTNSFADRIAYADEDHQAKHSEHESHKAESSHKEKEQHETHAVKTIPVEGEAFSQKLFRIESILYRRNTSAAQVAADLRDIKSVLTE